MTGGAGLDSLFGGDGADPLIAGGDGKDTPPAKGATTCCSARQAPT